MSETMKNLWTTKVFFFLRFVVVFCCTIIYFLTAAFIQYFYVSVFGESTFNYIFGAFFSLVISLTVFSILCRFSLVFARGWHMAALAYAPTIRKKGLLPLDAGMVVFRKHFLSFTVVYGVEFMLDKCMDKLAVDLWDVLEDIPVLSSLKSFSTLPPVQRVAKDLMSTMFDAVIFYIIRFSKETVKDDLTVIGDALKMYLYSLPSMLLASISNMLLFYLIPIVIRWITLAWLIFHNGLVAGLFQIVLMYPVFLVFNKVIAEPLQTVILVSSFSDKVKEGNIEEEQSDVVRKIVMSILEELGLINKEESEDSGDGESCEEEESQVAEEQQTPEDKEDQETTIAVEEELKNENSRIELEQMIENLKKDAPKRALSLESIANFESSKHCLLEDEDDGSDNLPIAEEEQSFLSRTSKLFNSLDFTMLNRGMSDDSQDDVKDVSVLLGGGDDEFD